MLSRAKVAVGRKLGIEPQLMKIIRATLYTHGEWFKLQMCKDQFEGLLWINSLKELGGSPFLGDASSKSTIDSYTQGSSPVTISSGNMMMHEDGSSPNQTSSSDVGCDENAILKVMVSSLYNSRSLNVGRFMCSLNTETYVIREFEKKTLQT